MRRGGIMDSGRGRLEQPPCISCLHLRVPRIRVLNFSMLFWDKTFSTEFKQGLDHSSKPASIQRDLSDNHFIIFLWLVCFMRVSVGLPFSLVYTALVSVFCVWRISLTLLSLAFFNFVLVSLNYRRFLPNLSSCLEISEFNFLEKVAFPTTGFQ